MAHKPRLFGTDGVRGVAGKYPLDKETVFGLGRAVGNYLAKSDSGLAVRVLLGEDTRESSPWISRTVAAGLRTSGAEITYAGIFTTPGVAFLTAKHKFNAGIIVSASHNPYLDNGIKVLGRSGMKLSEVQETQIESVLGEVGSGNKIGGEIGLKPAAGLDDEYVEHLAGLAPHAASLKGFRLVADCANGAASRIVPKLFEKLGIEGQVIFNTPDGRNINQQCGALHPQVMAETTRDAGAELGVALDGDADRAIFATSQGKVADGDHVLYAAAIHKQSAGTLRGGAIVGTLMTNLGLELALAAHGIQLRRTAVGDKHVLEEMQRSGANLGGEPSGHIIFSDVSLAGDGLITLLEVISIMRETRKTFAELVSGLRLFPQIIRNVRVREKLPLESLPGVAKAIEQCRKDVGLTGRVVVRYSGTEPLARVMVEAENATTVQKHAAQISDAIQSALGVDEAI